MHFYKYSLKSFRNGVSPGYLSKELREALDGVISHVNTSEASDGCEIHCHRDLTDTEKQIVDRTVRKHQGRPGRQAVRPQAADPKPHPQAQPKRPPSAQVLSQVPVQSLDAVYRASRRALMTADDHEATKHEADKIMAALDELVLLRMRGERS